MQLLPGIHLVGSGSAGFDLTDPFDCHVYLIQSENEAALIDAGAGIDLVPLCQRIEAALGHSKLTKLLLTHKHADHAGGAAFLKKKYGLEVIGSAHTAQVVGKGDESKMSLDEAKKAGVYPADYTFHPFRIDRIIEEGDNIAVGKVRLQVIETPGHSFGHVSFLADLGNHKTLFSGDSLFHGGQVTWQATYDCTVKEHVESIQKLARIDFDSLLPGHMAVSLQRGKRHVDAAMARISKLQLPSPLS